MRAQAPPTQPEWVTKEGADVPDVWIRDGPKRRCYVPVPGTIDNPLIFRQETFTDVIFELGKSSYLRFEACVFVRTSIEGAARQVFYDDDCEFRDASPSKNPVRVPAMGGIDNKLVFRQRDFVCTTMNLGDVHADFELCRFYESDVVCGRNVTMTSTSFDARIKYDSRVCPIAFFVMVNDAPVFGRVSWQDVHPPPPPVPAPSAHPRLDRAGSLASRFFRGLSFKLSRAKTEEERLAVISGPVIDD